MRGVSTDGMGRMGGMVGGVGMRGVGTGGLGVGGVGLGGGGGMAPMDERRSNTQAMGGGFWMKGMSGMGAMGIRMCMCICICVYIYIHTCTYI